MAAPVPLSVVIATTHGWPFIEACVGILLTQCEALGAELIVGDSSRRDFPGSLAGRIRHIDLPNASVFDLRARCTEAARGTIVAWTEDHCLPAGDWCAQILAAHARYPSADIIGGAVMNASTANAIDWANFLCTFGAVAAPIRRQPRGRGATVANFSIKRRALPRDPRAGFIELSYQQQRLRDGAIWFEDQMRVTHIQSLGFWRTFAAHFHNGRSTTGLLVDTLGLGRRLRQMLICAVLPLEVVRNSATSLWGKHGIAWRRYTPLMLGLAICFSAGEFVGLVTGKAGNSPRHLE